MFDEGTFNTSLGYFTGTANLDSSQNSDSLAANPVTVFPENTQAYIWISNGEPAGSTSAEWAILTNTNWRFPNGDTHAGGPVEWNLSDAGTTALFGTLSGEAPGLGETTTPGGGFTVQTATFISEPGVTSLFLLGLIMGLLRRSRSNSI
ncbi:MAG: hypothetical protein ACI8T1_000877 [Verrucomicrobiales bacterium]